MLRTLPRHMSDSADDNIAPRYKYWRRLPSNALPVKHKNTVAVVTLSRQGHHKNARVHLDGDVNERREAHAHGGGNAHEDGKALGVVVQRLHVQPDGAHGRGQKAHEPRPALRVDVERHRGRADGRGARHEHAQRQRRVHAHQVLLHVARDAAELEHRAQVPLGLAAEGRRRRGCCLLEHIRGRWRCCCGRCCWCCGRFGCRRCSERSNWTKISSSAVARRSHEGGAKTFSVSTWHGR
ncbi:TPA: hypothetical protein N0F65_005050 [Lagenidium giganteum]|uniref:Uncharacterized protein n=1 Tax=Lagenidium giganteum TaxID=4803 RepID=A0AAV2ZI17_9STRA|nr:TPA: hypothetical protein N0F65_005050 [Lagenidium giganteum]